jgi:hypothetical protein
MQTASCDDLGPAVTTGADAVWLVGPPVDLKIFPPNTNATTITAQSKMTKVIPATGESFAGGVGAGGLPKFVSGFVTSRLVAFEPFMINSTSSPTGARGTMTLWKHIGHSIIELLRHDSHLICRPQAGQTNLNSLMLLKRIPHSCDARNGFFALSQS